MIVWLGSYPRSGNTYARQILATCGGIKTYSIYGNGILSKGEIAEIIGHTALPEPFSTAVNSSKLYVVKTHSSPDVDSQVAEFPAIYIVRDGRDAIVSHARYLTTRKGGYGKLLRELVRGEDELRRSWSVHVMTWKDREVPTAYVRYEDLLAAPVEVMQQALDSLGIELKLVDTELVPFSYLHSMFPRFFRKGVVGSWKEEMPESVHEEFWKLHGEGMRSYGYKGGSYEKAEEAYGVAQPLAGKAGNTEEIGGGHVFHRHIRRGSKRRKNR